MPKFSYFISPQETPLSSKSDVWHALLPLARPASGETSKISLSHGEYFDAVRSYLEQDSFKVFSGVLTRHLQRMIEPDDIREIRIHLEKHGEFYHPARIEADVDDNSIIFVLNTAISDFGQKLIRREFYNLKRLTAEFTESYLPRVFSMGQVTSASGKTLCMFLGEWFDDYHEFHISGKSSGNRHKICVWDEKNGRYFLTREQASSVYRQSARIMTCYYNVSSFEHISQWHHAAGDFIVKQENHNLDLKLITARGYVPLFQKPDDETSGTGSAELILQALLIFLLKLSIRMRLDRIDGVGEIVWLDSFVVPSTVKGVFDGLAKKPAVAEMPDAIDTCFKYIFPFAARKTFSCCQSPFCKRSIPPPRNIP